MEIDVIEIFRQEYRIAKREAEYWNNRLAICRKALDEAVMAKSRLTMRAADFRRARGVLQGKGIDPVEDVRKLRGG